MYKGLEGLYVLVWMSLFIIGYVFMRARTINNTDQHKHRHVTTPKGAKRLLKMACNKVCMTARCVKDGGWRARNTNTDL